MAFVIEDCPTSFDFELSDGSVHSMPVPAALGVARMVALDRDIKAAKGGPEANAVFLAFVRECCPELADVDLSGYVVGKLAAAWYAAMPEK